MYDIKVDEFHTYFVGDGVLVYNRYRTGDLYETSFITKDGKTIEAMAEVTVNDKVVTLTNGAMYSNIGDIPNELGVIGLKE